MGSEFGGLGVWVQGFKVMGSEFGVLGFRVSRLGGLGLGVSPRPIHETRKHPTNARFFTGYYGPIQGPRFYNLPGVWVGLRVSGYR